MNCPHCYFEMEIQNVLDSHARPTGEVQRACPMCGHTSEICEDE